MQTVGRVELWMLRIYISEDGLMALNTDIHQVYIFLLSV